MPNIPTGAGEDSQRDQLLLILLQQLQSLSQALGYLSDKQADPTYEPGKVAALVLEMDVLMARIEEIKASGPFKYPSPADFRALRNAITGFVAIDGAAASAQEIVSAASGIIAALPLGSTKPGDSWIMAPERGVVRIELGAPEITRRESGPDPVQRDDAEYVVWYGTNRRRYSPIDIAQGYSVQRDSVVHYGSCRVFIPMSHKVGSTGSPWWKRLVLRTDDRLRLLEVHEETKRTYWQKIAAHMAKVQGDDRDAVIFVHGYNVSFESAALRTAQIGFDLQIRGAMAFFSWPSQATLGGYPADAATIEASEDMIADFMVDFATRSGAKSVHVIAHSMGNRGVLRAVNRIAADAQRRSKTAFDQFILAAADVDADTFRRLSTAYARVGRRTTLYVSTRDLAVEASRWLYDSPRAGLMPPVLVMPGIDTINVTNADLTLLGHGYVADAWDVLNDMHSLILHGTAPERRFGLRAVSTEAGERYWLVGRGALS